ncbi:hypothetical protein GC098_29395 [Paenibacillus sp. LMG 31458]|uniref:Spore germination GerAC-like C-terminal domain-containing protein n=1 Tax=Paenibacillus phytorum TaxID=2654977 RepID=A0ABX1Y3L1_9BACL|nr:Ger(x)C family spore germination C-terminal domain-containing protein [Paenibacillus phytorum]NOU75452.1 hypothetical protein [Paenibacillus phytorum]
MRLCDAYKEEGIDPLGFGELVRSKKRNWDAEMWEKEYWGLDVHLNVKVDLTEMGVKE